MSGIGGVVFGIAGLLALIALLPWLAERLRLPFTVLLAVVGCALGAMVGVLGSYEAALPDGPLRDFVTRLAEADLSSDLLLQVFLPLLLFEVALNLDGRALLDDLWPVLTLAVVAVLATTVVAGAAVWAVSDLPLAACLLVASVIATTDPAAVIAIFREVGAPRRLMTLVEGESLLNDAAAIALFTALLTIVGSQTAPDLKHTALDFLREFAGGALLGFVLGRVAALVVGRLDQGGPAEVTVSVALAYLSYEIAHEILHVSGVVAVVLAGLVFGTVARTRIAGREWQNVTAIWTQLGFWASSLVFVLASILTIDGLANARPEHLLYLAALIVGALAARAACLYLLLPLFFLRRPERRIGNRFRLVILWGGLRGAVTLSLVLALTEAGRIPDEVRQV
ncbi:MAG TPA: cation:proton antiporter, partial [Geminicoccaceae bacterium]